MPKMNIQIFNSNELKFKMQIKHVTREKRDKIDELINEQCFQRVPQIK